MDLYNHLNKYYKEKFGERVLKICVDAGFTCPNRDGKKSTGGCIFCSSLGSGERINNKGTIKEQITSFLDSYKGRRANKFIVYFQNFTNSYASIAVLKIKFDEAFCDKRIIGLDIATRFDEIDEEKCKLLSSYIDKGYYVCVELGLQTSNFKTREFINQKITDEEILNAYALLNKYHIDIILHIMVGLPKENHKDIVNTIKFINKLNYQGIKIHSTYINKGTVLENLYNKKLYLPLTEEEYLEELIYILTHINKNIIIHRITGDPDKTLLVSPSWTLHKLRILNHIEDILLKRNLYQGIYYTKEED